MGLFKGFSFYIRLIIDTIGDALQFLILYLVMLVCFANGLYVLNHFRDYKDPDDSLYERNWGFSTADAFLHIYIVSTGEFNVDNYTVSDGERVIWCFFYITTFMTTIVFFNMLINIMGQTLERLSDIKPQIVAKERLAIYNDFFFLKTLFNIFCCCCNRKKSMKQYIFMLKPLHHQDDDDTSESSLSNIQQVLEEKMDKISHENQELSQMLNHKFTIQQQRDYE